jgi:2-polyprenyl-3-methyl-5-hydroxy-6-metoxy-1,4-benzoquinol methylase
MANKYDQIEIDIESLHQEINSNSSGRYSQLEHYNPRFNRLLLRKSWLQKLIDSGLKREWFDEFREYWSAIGGRPIFLHDFFYLYSNYRTKFQAVNVGEKATAQDFNNAWQDYRNIYSTFHYAYKLALHPYSYLEHENTLDKVKGGTILEYGSGMTPIITSLIKDRKNEYTFVAADIKCFMYHYAKFRLKQHGVKFYDIEPYKFPEFQEKFDAIFVMTVMEHLPDPLNVIMELTSKLNPNGYLVFDYIKSDASGLDTKEAIEQRSDVLDFISSHYRIIQGNLDKNNSMGTTVVQLI